MDVCIFAMNSELTDVSGVFLLTTAYSPLTILLLWLMPGYFLEKYDDRLTDNCLNRHGDCLEIIVGF
jgi:hypothetical protein